MTLIPALYPQSGILPYNNTPPALKIYHFTPLELQLSFDMKSTAVQTGCGL
jgi:hypothetical protein